MKLLSKPLSILMFLILSIFISSSIQAQDESTSENNKTFFGLIKSVYLNGDAGYRFTSWKPMERTEEEGEILNFKTEGLHQINILAILGFKDVDFLTYSYEGPVIPTEKQKEMFSVNTRQEYGLEKYTAGINFTSIYSYFVPHPKPGFQYLGRILLSPRFRYSRELIFGEATATRSFYYVPYGVSFPFYGGVNLSLYRHIPAGSTVGFKTTFEDFEATIALYHKNNLEFRVGYMTSVWKRPSEYFKMLVDDTATLIFGTRFEARSLYFGVQTIRRSAPGTNVDAFLRSGIIESSMINAYGDMDSYFKSQDSSWLHYLGIYLDVWYNVYSKNERFSLTIGGIYDNRTWFRNYSDIDGKSDSRNGKIDIEEIFRGYLNVVVRI